MAGRPSTVATELLEPLAEYLSSLHSAYAQQPAGERRPTLPVTPAGKVNISAIASAIRLRIPNCQKSVAVLRKDLYRDELIAEINLIAELQGMLTAADTSEAGDLELQKRLAQQAKSASADARAAVISKAGEARLREELVLANAEIQRLRAQLNSLTLQIDLWRSGVAIRGLA